MIKVRGIVYYTVQEIAARLRVSPRTVNEWISRKVIPAPETARFGKHRLPVFTEAWLKQVRKSLLEHREKSGATDSITAALASFLLLPDEPFRPISEENPKKEKME
jgi:excisionase family DNA binding protein